jgi:hypothetical protein
MAEFQIDYLMADQPLLGKEGGQRELYLFG